MTLILILSFLCYNKDETKSVARESRLTWQHPAQTEAAVYAFKSYSSKIGDPIKTFKIGDEVRPCILEDVHGYHELNKKEIK